MSVELKRTLRTFVQIVVFAAIALPTVVDSTGLDDATPGVAVALGVALVVTRAMQSPEARPVLRWLGLDIPSPKEPEQ